MHNLFRLASLASPGGLLLQAPDGPRAARPARRGPDRHHRLPVRRGADLAAHRRLRQGPRGGRRVPRHLRAGPLLPGADGPRARHRAPGPGRPAAAGASDLDLPPLATNDLHYTYEADADAHEVLLCVQSGKTMADPNRFKFDGRRLLPQVAGGDAPALARAAGGLRQHAADRRAVAGYGDGVHHPRPDAALPGARPGETEESWLRQGGRARAGPAVPGRRPGRRTASRRSTRSASSSRWASRATSWSSPTSAGTPESHGIRVGPGPRLGGRLPGRVRAGHHRPRPARARAALRAVPQPRAHLDARHRPRLRRAPARRHDPLRHREVRRGAGRADHHVRHDQGQAGGQGLRPGARLPVRDRRPDHQGDAAAGDGQGRPAGRDLRPEATRATGRRPSSARSTSPTPRSSGSSTPPAGWRASSGSGACTRPA